MMRVETSRVADEMSQGSVEKSQQLAAYYRQKADLLDIHFMDAAGCEFNELDFMQLTKKKGHRQLTDRFPEEIRQIL